MKGKPLWSFELELRDLFVFLRDVFVYINMWVQVGGKQEVGNKLIKGYRHKKKAWRPVRSLLQYPREEMRVAWIGGGGQQR